MKYRVLEYMVEYQNRDKESGLISWEPDEVFVRLEDAIQHAKDDAKYYDVKHRVIEVHYET